MSQLSRALHQVGLLGEDGAPSGPLGLLGDIISLPVDALRGSIADIRARPVAIRMAIESANMRRDALQRLMAQFGGQQQGAPPQPQPGMTPGIEVQGAGQDLGHGLPMTEPEQAQLPADAGVVAQPGGSSLPPSVQEAMARPDYRQLQSALAQASLMGIRGASDAASIMRPHYTSVNGRMVNDADPTDVSGPIGVNLSNVNNTLVDLQDSANANRFVPEPPVRGAEPLYGPEGRAGGPVAWRMPSGAVQAIEQVSGAERRGQTENSIGTVTGSDGRTRTGYNRDLFGGGGQGGSSVITGPGPGDNTYANNTAQAAAQRYQAYQTDGQAASRQITQMQGLDNLLAGVNGNPASPAVVQVQQIARSFGIELNPNLGREEAAQALARGVALSFRGEMPGPLSNSDRGYLEGMTPGLAMTAEGRRQLIDARIAVARRQVEVASFSRQWQQRYGRIDAVDGRGRSFEDQLARYNETHPIFPQARRR